MLTLTIKHQWFIKIISGVMRTWSFNINPYYTSRFRNIGLLERDGTPTGKDAWIKISNGYGKDKPSARILVSIRIAPKHPGAEGIAHAEGYGGIFRSVQKEINSACMYVLDIKAMQTEM